MTSRERLLAAMRRQPVDRVPVTLYEFHDCGRCWAAEEPTYRPLLEAQARLGDTFVMAPGGGGLMGDPHSMRQALEDTPAGVVTEQVLPTPKGQLRSVSRRDPGVATNWVIEHFVSSRRDAERFLSIPYAFVPPDLEQLRTLEAALGHRGVLNFSIGDPLGNVVGVWDFQEFVMHCYTDLDIIEAMLDRAMVCLRDKVDFINTHFTDVCIRLWGPEYSGAPLMDPARFFEPLVVRYAQPLAEQIHGGGNLAILHCHGMLDAILEMIGDTGCDMLEPLEVLPVKTADVTLAQIKRRIGDRMCLGGGMQAVDLDSGTPELVRSRVRRIVEEAGPDGFIILPTSTPLEIPLSATIADNYAALFEAVAG